MRTTYLACLAAGLLAASAPAANAGHSNWTGGCTLNASWVSGTTWAGSATMSAVASPAGAAISMECFLHIDGVGGAVILAGSGFGAVADFAPVVTFSADELATVHICEDGVVDGHPLLKCHA